MFNIKECKSHGFLCDDDLETFQSIVLKAKEIYMALYIETTSSFMLLSRTYEKRIIGEIEDDEISFIKKDRNHTFLFSVPKSEITYCMFRKISDNQFDFRFQVYDITYSILIVI